jgi:hypothetical protein
MLCLPIKLALGQMARPESGGVMSDTFLTVEEVRELTGRTKHALQVDQLRVQGIPFFINVVGRPIVPRTAIEGRKEKVKPPEPAWVPDVLKNKS